MLEVKMYLEDTTELAIFSAVVAQIESRRERLAKEREKELEALYQQHPMKLVNVTDHGVFDVPPVPIEQAIEEAHAETTVVVEADLPLLATEAEAIAAYRGAIERGVSMPAIVGLLTEFGVTRVTALPAEKRMEFIAKVNGKLEENK